MEVKMNMVTSNQGYKKHFFILTTPQGWKANMNIFFKKNLVKDHKLQINDHQHLHHVALPWSPHHEHKVNSKNMNNNELGKEKLCLVLSYNLLSNWTLRLVPHNIHH